MTKILLASLAFIGGAIVSKIAFGGSNVGTQYKGFTIVTIESDTWSANIATDPASTGDGSTWIFQTGFASEDAAILWAQQTIDSNPSYRPR